MARNKKVDPDAGIHSCETCKDFDRHVRKLHGARLEGLSRSGDNPIVRKALEDFERNLPFIDARVREERAKGYYRT